MSRGRTGWAKAVNTLNAAVQAGFRRGVWVHPSEALGQYFAVRQHKTLCSVLGLSPELNRRFGAKIDSRSCTFKLSRLKLATY